LLLASHLQHSASTPEQHKILVDAFDGHNSNEEATVTMMTHSLLLTLLLGALHCCSSALDLSCAVDILNESGHKLNVYWLRPGTGEAVRYADVKSGATAVINSFVNHAFMIRDEVDECNEQEENCHVQYITVTDRPQHQRKSCGWL